jgi:SH3-like domain-containing protein
VAFFCAVFIFFFVGCGRGRGKGLETNYVSAPQAVLRDRVAAVYTKIGSVKNGDAVEVLDHDRRFVKVRTSTGVEGWIEQRYLISQQTFNDFQKLAQDNREAAVQAMGTTRNDTNIHLEPARDSDHLYQLATGDKVSIVKRATSERPTAANVPANSGGTKNSAKPMMEDWWLVRDAHGHTGWVLGRMVDIDVPLEVAQYAEGARIQAFFALDEVSDGDKKVPEYLVLLSESKDGMPFDYNQVRVFTWNLKRHRYETAYRERNLDGIFPVSVTHESFDKDGTLPVFILRVRDASGEPVERKYKLNTPIVRRVLAPGEKQEKAAARHR